MNRYLAELLGTFVLIEIISAREAERALATEQAARKSA